jgi:hypothetical protein
MNVEKSNEIFNQNLRLLLTCSEFKIECWNKIVTLHHMKQKDVLEYSAYGWDRRPENYEIENSFQLYFFQHGERIVICSIQSRNSVINFKGLNVLSSEHSMYSLTYIFEKLSEVMNDDVEYNFFDFDEGVLSHSSGKRIEGGERFTEYINRYVNVI